MALREAALEQEWRIISAADIQDPTASRQLIEKRTFTARLDQCSQMVFEAHNLSISFKKFGQLVGRAMFAGYN
jgi:hypothetical protein